MSRLRKLMEGLCPDGVEYKKLGEIGNFYNGLTGKKKEDFTGGNAIFISYMNVYSNSAINIDINDRVRIRENEKQNTIQYGDIIFTGSSETPDECGVSSVLVKHTEQKLYLNSFCFGYRFNDVSMFLPDFTKHLFRSAKLRYQIIKAANGVTRFNVSKKKMETVRIPVPPLEIQREIAHMLDNFAELTAELTAELALRKKQYNFYRDSLLNFVRMDDTIVRTDRQTQRISKFGRRIQKDIVWRTLGDIGTVCMCKRILKQQTNTESGIPFYKIGTFGKAADSYISEELFEEYKAKYSYPRKGEILISAAGTIGRTVIYDGTPAYFQDSNIVWIANDESVVLNRYLYYFYSLFPWSVAEGGTVARLYNDQIRRTEIPIPPLEVQQKIVSILDRFDALCNDLTNGLPAEIAARKKQYEHYRDKLLTFPRSNG